MILNYKRVFVNCKCRLDIVKFPWECFLIRTTPDSQVQVKK